MLEIKLSLEKDKEMIRKICDALGSDIRLNMLVEVKKDKNNLLNKSILAARVGRSNGAITRNCYILTEAGITSETIVPGKRGSSRIIPKIEIKRIIIDL